MIPTAQDAQLDRRLAGDRTGLRRSSTSNDYWLLYERDPDIALP